MAKQKIAMQDHFEFGGHSFYVQFKELDGDSLDQIRNFADGFRPDHFSARAVAIRRTVHSLKMDGKEIRLDKLKSDGTSGFPKVVDRETKETLTDALCRYVVKVEPDLLVLAPDTFGKYEEDEEEGGFTPSPAPQGLSPQDGE